MAELHLPHAGAASGGTSDGPPGHEQRDVNIGGVFGFAVGLAAAAAMIHFLVWVLFTFFQSREARNVAPEYPLAVEERHRVPPEPRLQANPRQDLIDLQRHEDEILNSYGWVDRNAGTVRIPIDQAIKLTLDRGMPTRQEQK